MLIELLGVGGEKVRLQDDTNRSIVILDFEGPGPGIQIRDPVPPPDNFRYAAEKRLAACHFDSCYRTQIALLG